MRKATKAVVVRRVEEVLRIRLDGAEFWDVREYAREKEQEAGSAWQLPEGGKPLSDGQLWRYIGMADKMIAGSCRASRKRLLRRHLAQRRNLYAKAVSQGDIRAALAVLDSEAKLTGLFEDELNRMVEKLAQQIEEIKRHGHGNPPQALDANASRSDRALPAGVAGPAAPAGGPGTAADRRRHSGGGPLADDVAPLAL